MAELTREGVIARVKSGDSLKQEDLSALDLSVVNLTKADLTRANLSGATYDQYQLKDSLNVDKAIL